MKKLNSILKTVYEPTFRHIFQNHPHSEKIMEKLMSDEEVPTELIDLWFTEAEYYTHEKLTESMKNMPVNKDGTVTFKVVK